MGQNIQLFLRQIWKMRFNIFIQFPLRNCIQRNNKLTRIYLFLFSICFDGDGLNLCEIWLFLARFFSGIEMNDCFFLVACLRFYDRLWWIFAMFRFLPFGFVLLLRCTKLYFFANWRLPLRLLLFRGFFNLFDFLFELLLQFGLILRINWFRLGVGIMSPFILFFILTLFLTSFFFRILLRIIPFLFMLFGFLFFVLVFFLLLGFLFSHYLYVVFILTTSFLLIFAHQLKSFLLLVLLWFFWVSLFLYCWNFLFLFGVNLELFVSYEGTDILDSRFFCTWHLIVIWFLICGFIFIHCVI